MPNINSRASQNFSSNRPDRLRYYFFILLTIILLAFLEFLALLPLPWLKPLTASWQNANYRLLQLAMQPAQRFLSLWDLSAELLDLQARYATTAAEMVRLQNVEAENQELRLLLENSDRRLGTTIITSPITSFAQTRLPVGSEQGVRVGALVLYRNNLLARVSQVEPKQSQITLLQHLTEGGILAVTEGGVKGLVKGDGWQVLLTEVTSGQTLRPQELVLTAGQEGVEKGLVIGQIQTVQLANPALATITAVVEPLVNFYQLELVELK